MKSEPRTYRKLTPLANAILQGGPSVGKGGVEQLLEEHRKNPRVFEDKVKRVLDEAKRKVGRHAQ